MRRGTALGCCLCAFVQPPDASTLGGEKRKRGTGNLRGSTKFSWMCTQNHTGINWLWPHTWHQTNPSACFSRQTWMMTGFSLLLCHSLLTG